jgi:hypothetical protein
MLLFLASSLPVLLLFFVLKTGDYSLFSPLFPLKLGVDFSLIFLYTCILYSRQGLDLTGRESFLYVGIYHEGCHSRRA